MLSLADLKQTLVDLNYNICDKPNDFVQILHDIAQNHTLSTDKPIIILVCGSLILAGKFLEENSESNP